MRHERQVQLLKRLAASGERQTGLFGDHTMVHATSAYTDADRFAQERRILFRAGPVLLGLSAEIAGPGSYRTAEFGGVPVVIVRQADGSLRGFVNACRHRGTPLLEGSGERLGRISCPLHAWAYRIDGSLHSKPFSDGAFDDVTTDCDLLPIAVAEKHGLVFVRPSSTEPIDIDAFLAGAQDDLGAYALNNCVHIESRSTTWKANWKMILDTFTESYHIRTLHRESIAPMFLSGCTLFEPFGQHLLNIGLHKSVLDEMKKPADEQRLLPHATAQYFLLPNAMLCHQLDHIELWRLEPIDVHTTRVNTSVFAMSGPVNEKLERYLKKNLELLVNVTGTEDFPLIERSQATLDSGMLPEVLYGRIEPALAHFHQSVNAALSAGGLH